jgi:hypothetical protein
MWFSKCSWFQNALFRFSLYRYVSGVTGTAVGPGAGAGRKRFNSVGTVNSGVVTVSHGGSRPGTTKSLPVTHQHRAGGGRQKPTSTDQPLRSGVDSSSLESALRERLDELERGDAASTSSRAEAGDDDNKVDLLSSVFDTIISRSKTYGHLLATIKRHYEQILVGRQQQNNNNNSAAAVTASSLSHHRPGYDVANVANGSAEKDPMQGRSSGGGDRGGGVDGGAAKLSAAEAQAAEAQAAADATKAKVALKTAEQRAAIAKAAAASAARAQVAAEAEAIRLTGANQRLRDEANAHFAAIKAAAAESEASQFARDGAIAAQNAAEAAVADLTTTCGTLEVGLYKLNAVDPSA